VKGIRGVVAVAAFCVVALLATLLAQIVWSGLLATNLKASSAIPWAVPVMAVILWAIWRYFGGAWWPASNQEARRRYRRADAVPGSIFRLAMVAGLLALAALIALWLVLVQLVKLPGNPAANFGSYSLLTIVTILVMASIVGAITEELGLRGYMLTRLESAVGGWTAVVLVAVIISPGHGLTQGFVWPTLLWYFVADVMFGALSYLTRSILPGIAVHAIGLLAFFAVIWPTDKYRHVGSLGQQPVAFWIEVALLLILSAAAVILFRQLALVTSTTRKNRALMPSPQAMP
jgi:membrane protease YdiL (CAAX protease family)